MYSYTLSKISGAYQNLSKLALRGFSIAVQAIIVRHVSMIHPVQPGPETKLACSHPTKPSLFLMANWAKLLKWANVWSQEKNTMDQAVTKSKHRQKIIRYLTFGGLNTLVESDVLICINCQQLRLPQKKIATSKPTKLYNPIESSLSGHRDEISTYSYRKISPKVL